MHEGISLTSGGSPLKSYKIGAMSTCPHDEVHPRDKDIGYRGRWSLLSDCLDSNLKYVIA